MKKALITGASSGLGREIGSLLSERQCKVVNLSRSESDFEDIKADLSEDISEAIATIKSDHPDIDLIIMNAGSMPLAEVGNIGFDVDKLFRVNVTGSIKIIDSLMDLIKTNETDIIFVGSTASFKGSHEHSVYCATKHALEGFIKSLRIELRDYAVRVIGFHPGGFNSNLRGGLMKEGYMDPKELADLLMNIIELPKSMEVSNIVINRNKHPVRY